MSKLDRQFRYEQKVCDHVLQIISDSRTRLLANRTRTPEERRRRWQREMAFFDLLEKIPEFILVHHNYHRAILKFRSLLGQRNTRSKTAALASMESFAASFVKRRKQDHIGDGLSATDAEAEACRELAPLFGISESTLEDWTRGSSRRRRAKRGAAKTGG